MSTENTLWTRDFTIITIGSVISMLGNAMSGFAISLMVLDFTESTMLYAIYLAVFTIPQIIVPIISGAILDRFSRKRTIYTLDFLSSILYGAAAFVLHTGWFNFPIFAVLVFLVGSIHSIYMVAYQSFYPLLITEGNFSKAYSIASVLETLAVVMVPVSTFVYKQVGISPLLAVNALCFFLAAVMETQIRTTEKYIDVQKKTEDSQHRVRQMLNDIHEGFTYLRLDRGLLAIAAYFTFSALTYGISNVLTLPYFRSTFNNGEYVYMVVMGASVAGRAIGGGVHYRMRIPARRKFMITLFVYMATALIEGAYLFLPVPAMFVAMLCSGLLGVTSWTIRISATQAYVPDEKKGRFNGAFNMLNTCGSLIGELTAGWLAYNFASRTIILLSGIIQFAAAVAIMGTNRKSVSKIYNVNQ
ncbi:MAG: MFS transporter [Solobacterium sp.]|nr:MFS transporter [Solobacterium sp.]